MPDQPELRIDPPAANATERARQRCCEELLRGLASLRFWIDRFPIDDEKQHEALVERLGELCDDMRGSILEWSRLP
ncbi:hypothetical protein LCGC14_0754350 [marine sediment metagenome]|uniref:Uncharacterized protein n=1 Tax=marine sediment metagenome TaxID=412755 RepID=A0A0F9Q348_9ZZZZ